MTNKNQNNENLNKNAVPETPDAEKKEKIRIKDRIRNFGEKHPKVTKIGKYAAAVGAGALIALGGKSVLEAFGGHPGAEDDYDGASSAPEPAAEKEEKEESEG